ncbi:HVO_A0556 family zinc finger protein [Halopiger thermotolerans]
MRQQEGPSLRHPVIEGLEGSQCSFCNDGQLVQERYKGNTAVVCENCHTPNAQVW